MRKSSAVSSSQWVDSFDWPKVRVLHRNRNRAARFMVRLRRDFIIEKFFYFRLVPLSALRGKKSTPFSSEHFLARVSPEEFSCQP